MKNDIPNANIRDFYKQICSMHSNLLDTRDDTFSAIKAALEDDSLREELAGAKDFDTALSLANECFKNLIFAFSLLEETVYDHSLPIADRNHLDIFKLVNNNLCAAALTSND